MPKGVIRGTYAVPNADLAEGVEVILVLALVVFSIIAAVAMYRKRRSFPVLFLWQWVFAVVISVANLVVPALLMGIPLWAMMNAESTASILVVVIVGGLWVLYVFRSVRVQNTLVTRRGLEPRGVNADHGSRSEEARTSDEAKSLFRKELSDRDRCDSRELLRQPGEISCGPRPPASSIAE